jgi:hypothetical protein
MKRDCIEISGKEYPVEFNWNTTANFLDNEGLKLAQADDLRNLKASQITGLIYEGVREGCRMHKIDFPFSKEDFAALLQPKNVTDLLTIYAKQTSSPLLVVKKK